MLNHGKSWQIVGFQPLQEHVFSGDFQPLQASRCGFCNGSAMEAIGCGSEHPQFPD